MRKLNAGIRKFSRFIEGSNLVNLSGEEIRYFSLSVTTDEREEYFYLRIFGCLDSYFREMESGYNTAAARPTGRWPTFLRRRVLELDLAAFAGEAFLKTFATKAPWSKARTNNDPRRSQKKLCQLHSPLPPIAAAEPPPA